MKQLEYTAHNLTDTDNLGRVLAACLPNGTTVALCGTLGSGKTRLVQSLATACGIPDGLAVSPTFVLCNEYHGRRMLYHLDAYRLKDADEFLQLGPEEYFASPAITLIEWADRVASCLPESRLEVQIEVVAETTRRFELTARGAALEHALDDAAKLLGEQCRPLRE